MINPYGNRKKRYCYKVMFSYKPNNELAFIHLHYKIPQTPGDILSDLYSRHVVELKYEDDKTATYSAIIGNLINQVWIEEVKYE